MNGWMFFCIWTSHRLGSNRRKNRHVAVEVRDIRAVRAYLEREGAGILEAVPMVDRERFYLLDPFGNYIELIELKNS